MSVCFGSLVRTYEVEKIHCAAMSVGRQWEGAGGRPELTCHCRRSGGVRCCTPSSSRLCYAPGWGACRLDGGLLSAWGTLATLTLTLTYIYIYIYIHVYTHTICISIYINTYIHDHAANHPMHASIKQVVHG